MPSQAFENILHMIICTSPDIQLAKVKPHLLTFISHPIIKELIGQSDAPAQADVNTSPNLDLQKIQESLQQLSKAVEALKKAPPPFSNKDTKASKSKQKSPAPPSAPPCTFSAIAGARPPNPSLLVDLAKLSIGKEGWVKLEILYHALNKELAAVTPPQVQLVAIRWMAKGNLVITGGPATTPHTLQLAAPHISASLLHLLSLPTNSPPLQPRPNTKWSKILINSIPTGASNNRSPLTPDECHAALAALNPSYATLSITQKPSWVCSPSSYLLGTISSLSVAFEDPDGSKLKVILAECYLYALGNRALVVKWKYHQKHPKDNSKPTTGQHTNTSDFNDDENVTTYSHSQSHRLRQQVHHLHSQANPHTNHPIRPDRPNLLMPSRWALWHSKHMCHQALALLKWLPYRPTSCILTLSFLRHALRATRVQGSCIVSQAESHITRHPFIHYSGHYITFLKSYMGHHSPSGLFSHLLSFLYGVSLYLR